MKYDERRDIILRLLKEKDCLLFDEILQAVQVSPATLRRDIKKMSDNKIIERFHGGVRLSLYVKEEIPIQERKNISLQIKKRIAKYAANLINPGELIFIDSGTTTLAMIDYINETSITVITNGILHTQKLKEKNINCFLLCGFLKYRSNALLGSETVALMKKFRFDKAFLGSNAIDYTSGLSTSDDYEAALKQTGIAQSSQVYILSDSSKFGRRSLYTVENCNQAKVIYLSDKKQDQFHGFQLTVVDEDV